MEQIEQTQPRNPLIKQFPDPFRTVDFWASVEQVLTPEEFRIIGMHFVLDMTQAEIAKELGVTPQAIGQRMRRSIKKLRERL